MSESTPTPQAAKPQAPGQPKDVSVGESKLDDPKAKAQAQLAGDLPPDVEPMSKAQIEKALGRELQRHEMRWVQR